MRRNQAKKGHARGREKCPPSRHWIHEYINPITPTGELPPPDKLMEMFNNNPQAHEKLWMRAAGNSMPIVVLGMQNILTRISKKVLLLVDTGSDITTLTGVAADDLEIDRRIRPGNAPALIKDAGGTVMIGLRRWIWVYLGDCPHIIPVLVPPAPGQLTTNASGTPLGQGPKFNVLGRARILEHFELCFNAKTLHVHPKGATWPTG